MQKSSNIEINAEDPYKYDQLSRQNDVANISNLLQNFTSPMTMSITAPWGQGKTTFVKMLKAELNNENCTSVYFSAWETDFATDPLVAFLGEMNEALESHIQGDTIKTKLLEKTKKITTSIAIKAIPSIIKTATLGIIDASEEVEEIIGGIVGEASKNIIDAYTKSKSEIKEFKKNIEKILTDENGHIEKIYIFVDELDRCRPTYAIELLERIKHLLDVEGLVFILAIDKIQLIESIKGIYGANFDAREYLKRFVDLEYKLPETSIETFIKTQIKHYKLHTFFEKRKAHGNFGDDAVHLINTFLEFAKIKKLTLRDIEQYFVKLNLAIKTTADEGFLTPSLTLFLMLLRDYDPEAYALFSNDESSVNSLTNELYKFSSNVKTNSPYIYSILEAQIILSKENTQIKEVREIFSEYRNIMEGYEFDDVEHDHYRNMMAYMNTYREHHKITLEKIIFQIEMLTKFNFDD